MIDKVSVLKALGTVIDPDFKKDLVTLGMIHDVDVQGARVSFRVELTTPACPMKAKIEADCRQAIEALGAEAVIKMDARVQAPKRQGAIPGVRHVIAVSSGKGGVGKSTVAVSLALSLAKDGARVGLMDADVYGPNVPLMLGPCPQPVLEDNVFIPPQVHGIKVMSMAFLVPADQPAIWRGPMLHSIVQQFCYQVAWGELDYLVVDMPPGTGDVQLSLAQLVPVTGVVLVTTPEQVAVADVRKAYHMFEKVKVPVLGFVENMSYFICDQCDKKHMLFGQGGGVFLAQQYNSELLAAYPLMTGMGSGGLPLALSSDIFLGLSRRVAQKIAMQALEREPEIGAFK